MSAAHSRTGWAGEIVATASAWTPANRSDHDRPGPTSR